MNGITFNRQNGGLGRRLPGEDHISGLLIYEEANHFNGNLPVWFDSVADLENNGIQPAEFPYLHYHVSEYFRINPNSRLLVCQPSVYDFSQIQEMQNFAEGKLRQIGIFDNQTPFTNLVPTITIMQSRCHELAYANAPLSVLYFNSNIASANMLTLPNLKTLNADRVSVLLGTDGGGRAWYDYLYGLWVGGVSYGNVGAVLGAVSRAKVHESIAWVERQNLVTTAYDKDVYGEGTTLAKELDVPAFVDGSLVSSYTRPQLQTLHDKGYIFMVKHVGMAGTYLNDSFTATGANSDFAYIENNRTMDKAQRGVYTALLPKISGPLLIDATSGFIREDVAASLEALAAQPLEQMERDGEISGFNVFINPEQEVLQTSVLNVTLSVVPVGVMRNIVVNLGFTLQV